MSVTPLARSLAYCRQWNYPAAKTEHWNHFAKIRQDLFGAIDLLVLDGLPGVLGVQVTTQANAAARVAKCKEVIPPQWFAAGNRLEVWAWAQRGPRGKRKTWTVKKIVVTK